MPGRVRTEVPSVRPAPTVRFLAINKTVLLVAAWSTYLPGQVSCFLLLLRSTGWLHRSPSPSIGSPPLPLVYRALDRSARAGRPPSPSPPSSPCPRRPLSSAAATSRLGNSGACYQLRADKERQLRGVERTHTGDMRDMGEKQRRHGHGHVHAVGFGAGGFGHAEHEEKRREEKKLDMSGMSMDTLPNPTMPLGNITTLDLSNNNLESVPESIIARLLNVVVLDVHSNQLTSLPNSIGCLSKLKVLNVSGNLLRELPATIEECRALEELNANFNQLTRLPDTLGFELHGLRRLSVNSNKLACLPSSTSHMLALRSLDARLNCLRELPDGLENLGSLEALNVSQNFQYLRELPYGIGLLVSLRELDVSYNSIAALPDSMGCLTKLARFSAAGNPLVCPPMDVVDQSLDAMRAYLSARMNGTAAKSKKKSWVPKLVKYSTFSAGMMTPGRTSKVHGGGNADGLHMSDYQSLHGGGIASPGFLSMLSPRRLFSPRRHYSSKY